MKISISFYCSILFWSVAYGAEPECDLTIRDGNAAQDLDRILRCFDQRLRNLETSNCFRSPCVEQTQPKATQQLITMEQQLPKPMVSLIEERYQDNGDGSVTDIQTHLIWKCCSEGQTWTGNKCSGNVITMTWNEAMPGGDQKTWAEFAGCSEWRVPTIKELLSLVYCSSGQPQTWNYTGDKCEGNYNQPTIVVAAFPNTPVNWFWSASPIDVDLSAHAVNFNDGYDDMFEGQIRHTYRVRLVCSAR